MAWKANLGNLVPQSTAARVGIATFFILLISHGLGFVMAFLVSGNDIYLRQFEERVGRTQLSRTAAAVRALDATSVDERPNMAHLLSDPLFPIEVRAELASCDRPVHAGAVTARLAMDLNRSTPEICVVSASGTPQGRPDYTIQIPLHGSGAALFQYRGPGPAPSTIQSPNFWHIVVSLLLAGAAALAIRALIRPFTDFAKAAERLGVDQNAPPMSESGPIEVSTAVRAFNAMQTRIQRFVADRTQMIAAISHDLRTPITRLRLRAEFITDGEQQAAINGDLDEMEKMVTATLDFVRADLDPETPREFDLAELLRHLAAQRQSVGQTVRFHGSVRPYFGRAAQLSRALANLIDNAVKYGNEADVALTDGPEGPEVTIGDRGAGIPMNERERVFRPFYRIETSRSRETGGVGLGLNVARSIVTAHGGTIELADRFGGGLQVTVRLGEQRG